MPLGVLSPTGTNNDTNRRPRPNEKVIGNGLLPAAFLRSTINRVKLTGAFRLLGLLVLVGLLVAGAGGSAHALVAAGLGGGVGSGILNGGFGSVESVSCGGPGDCAAGGFYEDGRGKGQAFVVSEDGGNLGRAIEVPGTARLNAGDAAEVDSVSCVAPGDCAAGGFYEDGRGKGQAFVVSETNGRWGKAIAVPGAARLNTDGSAEVTSVSCPAAGDCAAVGYYTDGRGRRQGFLVSETAGRWGKAIEVPGTAKLNTGGSAGVDSVSCAAPGDCSAAGYYVECRSAADPTCSSTDSPFFIEVFVVSERNGHWGKAIEVPGTATLNTGGNAEVRSVSCAAPGDCAAGGLYTVPHSRQQAFVVSQTNGHWGKASEVPGTAKLNAGGLAAVGSVSCAAPGNCAAGGFYTDYDQGSEEVNAFVVSDTNGSWGNAIEVPGTAQLNTGGDAGVESISCTATGECAASGSYSTGPTLPRLGIPHAFVVGETNGSWESAAVVPGASDLPSISCASAGDCAGGGPGGSVFDGFRRRAFVVSETNGTWGSVTPLRDFPAACVVPHLLGTTLGAATKKLDAADCRAGKITKAYSHSKKGRVVAQHPKPGKHLKPGARVALTVSKGLKT